MVATTVFVGNIPYDINEEQLKEIFSQVGPVNNFRIVRDPATQKPKGYGFCEYQNEAHAMCAIQNLTGYEISGRTLKVGNADGQNKPTGPSVAPTASQWGGSSEQQSDVAKALSKLSMSEIYDVISEMKSFIQRDPAQAKALLQERPILTQALLKAQLMLGMLHPDIPKVSEPPRQMMAPMMHTVPQARLRPQYHQSQFQPPGGYAGGPPMPGYQAPQQAPAAGHQLLQEVMNFTPEQIAMLPPEQRTQILAIRKQFNA